MKNTKLKLTLIALVIFVIINNIIFVPANILSWDVFGYYLYLPFKFIYHDLGLKNEAIVHSIIAKYNNTGTFYQAMKLPDGVWVMKYTMGLSVLYSPFFFIAHIIAKIFNYTADGFSLPYQYSIFVGSIIYSLLGIVVLAKVLKHFFTEKISAIVLVLIVVATNFIVHITMYGQNAMSHNYLFLAYSLILWLTILWHKYNKTKHIVYLAIVCGLTILSRPSEVVCLFIPFFWGIHNKNSIIDKFKLFIKFKVQILLFAIILLLIGSAQLIYWKITVGKFLFNSYGGNAGEGFEFLKPYILQVLFSFRKGWLLYTPVMILAIIGFYHAYKRNVTVFYALFIYFIFNLYIVSSWSCWWYAQTFSQRSLIPSYPVMAIGLGFFLTWLNTKNNILKGILYSIILFFIVLNIFQTIQFHRGVIDSDKMTKEYYFAVFGRLHTTDADKKLLLINRSFDGTENFNNKEDYNCRLLTKLDFENCDKKDSTFANSGHYSFKLDSTTIYSPSIEAPYNDITSKDHAWIQVTAYVYPTMDLTANPFCLVANFEHKGFSYKYCTSCSENMKLELNKWNKITFEYLTPEVRNTKDNLKVYVWNRGKQPLYVDDLQVDVYERK